MKISTFGLLCWAVAICLVALRAVLEAWVYAEMAQRTGSTYCSYPLFTELLFLSLLLGSIGAVSLAWAGIKARKPADNPTVEKGK